MATFAQVRRERQQALAAVRRAERTVDSKIERMERRIFRLKDRKTVLDSDDALNLSTYYSAIVESLRELERSLTDFNTVVSD